MLVRRKLPPPASVQVYELTPWGYEAAPIFQALGRWAVRSPHHDPTRPFSPVSLMLSLRTMLSPSAAGDLEAPIQLIMNGEPFFWARNRQGEIRIGRGEIEEPDLIIRGTPERDRRLCLCRRAPVFDRGGGRSRAGRAPAKPVPDAGKSAAIALLEAFCRNA